MVVQILRLVEDGAQCPVSAIY